MTHKLSFSHSLNLFIYIYIFFQQARSLISAKSNFQRISVPTFRETQGHYRNSVPPLFTLLFPLFPGRCLVGGRQISAGCGPTHDPIQSFRNDMAPTKPYRWCSEKRAYPTASVTSSYFILCSWSSILCIFMVGVGIDIKVFFGYRVFLKIKIKI